MGYKDLPPIAETILGEAEFVNRDAPRLNAAIERADDGKVTLNLYTGSLDNLVIAQWFLPQGLIKTINGKEPEIQPFPHHIVVQTQSGKVTFLGWYAVGSNFNLRNSDTAKFELNTLFLVKQISII